MPAVTKFDVTPKRLPCGNMLSMDVGATFESAKGGEVTVRIAGDNRCYFELTGEQRTKSITVPIKQIAGGVTIRRRVRCEEAGDTAITVTAAASSASGTSAVRRRVVTVTGC